MRRWQVLEGLVRKHGWTDGVELGVLKGETFLHLLSSCPRLAMTGVDTYKFVHGQVFSDGGAKYKSHDFDAYHKSIVKGMKGYGDRAKLLVMTTIEGAARVPHNSLDFVFIDASHTYEAVISDIVTWAPKLRRDGWLIGHDTHFPTVQAALDVLLPGWQHHEDHVWAIPLRETILAHN